MIGSYGLDLGIVLEPRGSRFRTRSFFLLPFYFFIFFFGELDASDMRNAKLGFKKDPRRWSGISAVVSRGYPLSGDAKQKVEARGYP